MFENLFTDASTIARHHNGPLIDERCRYLLHCASVGATLHTQRNRARAILRLAMLLPADVSGQVDAELLRHLISAHQPPATDQTATGLLNIGRPWLKFIGWWHQPAQPIAFPEALDRFVVWMRDERGLTPCTVEQWRYRTANFLRWCKETGRDLKSLEPEDMSAVAEDRSRAPAVGQGSGPRGPSLPRSNR